MPRKLGQHFLKDKKQLKKIVAALEINSRDVVVEIGPGHGELTKYLLEANPKKIIAVEKDPRFAVLLQKNFQFTILDSQSKTKLQLPKRGVIEGDALKLLPNFAWKLKIKNWKLTGNIPYYITGHLLRKVSELKNKPKLIVFTLQKEVAERIAARPPRMNLLAASVQFWGEPKIIGSISKKSFKPQPKVDSAIIKIKLSPQTSYSWFGGTKRGKREGGEKYYRFIRILFKQPRKTVFNNLRDGFNLSQEEVEKRLKKLNLSVKLRPADLSLSNINKLVSNFL